MQINKLLWLRFFTPAFIALFFLSLFGSITGYWDIVVNSNLREWAWTPPVFIIAIVLYVLNLRNPANRYWYNKVNENLRSKLVAISGVDDKRGILVWKTIRPVFYSFVDNDESLKKKVEIAYFNGWLWTTIADVRAFSGLFIFISVIFAFVGGSGSTICILVFLILFLLTFPASHVITKKHMSIGDQQIEIIQSKYKSELSEKLKSIHEVPSH